MHHVWSSVGLRLFFFPSTVSLSFYLGHGDDLPLFLIRARLLRCCFCSVEQSQHPSHLDSNDLLFLLSQGRGSHRPMHLTLSLHKNEMKDDFLINARLASVIRLRFFSSLSWAAQKWRHRRAAGVVLIWRLNNWFEILMWASVEMKDTVGVTSALEGADPSAASVRTFPLRGWKMDGSKAHLRNSCQLLHCEIDIN